MELQTTNSAVERYGTKAEFLNSWKPAIETYCHNNLEKSVGTPSLNVVRNGYGEDVAITFVCKLIVDFLVFRGEDDSMDEMDVMMCASLIINNRELCMLNLPFIMNFFFDLKCGKYKIFGSVNAGKIMECFQEYYQWAFSKQNEYFEAQRKKAEKEEYEKNLQAVMKDRAEGKIQKIDYGKLFININEL